MVDLPDPDTPEEEPDHCRHRRRERVWGGGAERLADKAGCVPGQMVVLDQALGEDVRIASGRSRDGGQAGVARLPNARGRTRRIATAVRSLFSRDGACRDARNATRSDGCADRIRVPAVGLATW